MLGMRFFLWTDFSYLIVEVDWHFEVGKKTLKKYTLFMQGV
jgi:hypothetical protein